MTMNPLSQLISQFGTTKSILITSLVICILIIICQTYNAIMLRKINSKTVGPFERRNSYRLCFSAFENHFSILSQALTNRSG